MKPSLTPELIETVRSGLKGKKLEKFNESIAILQESLAQDGWTPRGSIKAQSGLYQGVAKYNVSYHSGPEHNEDFALMMCLNYGSPAGEIGNAIDRLFTRVSKKTGKLIAAKMNRQFVEAWVEFCREAYRASEYLTALRPKPVITEIGLSPKVTATLKDMSLDINLPSLKPAEIKFRQEPAFDKDGNRMYNRLGEPMFNYIPYVDWTPGTKFNRTRFSYTGNCNCEACGKRIPSGMFVPVEADDQNSGDRIGMWIGVDCARNIFGIKDKGLNR